MKSKAKSKKLKVKNGFTFIELLVVIGITTILSGAIMPMYNNLFGSTAMTESTRKIIQDAHRAQVLSQGRINNDSYGIYFEVNPMAADKMIFYRGASYAERLVAYDEPMIFDSNINVETTLPSNELHYSAGVGVPSSVGTISVRFGQGETRVIIVNPAGVVVEQ